jgi:hypothetical protein
VAPRKPCEAGCARSCRGRFANELPDLKDLSLQQKTAEANARSPLFGRPTELSSQAAIEVRRLFPGITDNAKARECARTIAGWKPLPDRSIRKACAPPWLRRPSPPPTKV